MKRVLIIGSSALLTAGALVAPAASAQAAHADGRPTVTSVRSNYGATVGYTHVTVRGSRFTDTSKVTFGSTPADIVHVLSSHTLIAYAPGHRHGTVQVRVRTEAGTSPKSDHDRYTYVHQVAPGTWAASTAPVPSGRPADDFVTASTSCPTATTCYTVGTFGPAKYGRDNPPDETDTEGGVLATTRASGETTTQQIALPAGVVPKYTTIKFLSCPGVGSCVAAGNTNGDDGEQGLLLVLADGTWTVSTADLDQGEQPTEISGLSCAAAGECTVTGNQFRDGSSSGAVLLRLHNGTWSTSDVVPPHGQSGAATLTGIDCASASYCLAAGSYGGTTKNAGVFVVQVLDGVQTMRSIPNSPRDGRATSIDAVQCPAVSRCTVLGEFGTGLHRGTDFVSVDEGTNLTIRPITLPVEADTHFTLDADDQATMTCPAVSVCYAAGAYYYPHVARDIPAVARLDGSKVHLYNLPRPTGIPKADITVNDIDCASSRACTAVGSADIRSFNGPSEGAYFTFANGVWTTEVSNKAPGQKSAPTQTSFDTVDCPAVGACTAGGNYIWDLQPDDDSDGQLLFTKASGLVGIETPN